MTQETICKLQSIITNNREPFIMSPLTQAWTVRKPKLESLADIVLSIVYTGSVSMTTKCPAGTELALLYEPYTVHCLL